MTTLLKLKYWLSRPTIRRALTAGVTFLTVLVVVIAFTPVLTTGLTVSPLVSDTQPDAESTATIGAVNAVTATMEESTASHTAGDGLRNQVVYPAATATNPVVTTQPTHSISGPGTTDSKTHPTVIDDVRVANITTGITYEVHVIDGAASSETDDAIWTDTEPIASRTTPTSATQRLTGRVNILDVADRVEQLRVEFGDTVEVTVDYTIDMTYTVTYRDATASPNAATAADTTTRTDTVSVSSTSPIDVTGITRVPERFRTNPNPGDGHVPTYQFVANDITTGIIVSNGRVQKTTTDNTATTTGGALTGDSPSNSGVDAWLLGAAMLLAVVTGAALTVTREGEITDADLEYAAHQDWITTVDTLPPEATTPPGSDSNSNGRGAGPDADGSNAATVSDGGADAADTDTDTVVNVHDLAGLVDIAIDNRTRVLSPQRDKHLYVVTDTATYRCPNPAYGRPIAARNATDATTVGDAVYAFFDGGGEASTSAPSPPNATPSRLDVFASKARSMLHRVKTLAVDLFTRSDR